MNKLSLGLMIGIIFLFTAILSVAYAATNNTIGDQVNRFCQNASKDPVIGYLCNLRGTVTTLQNQNNQLQTQVTDLQTTVASLEAQLNGSTLFDEEFNGTAIDTQKWDAYPNGGTITISNGQVTLAGGSVPGRFPFIQTKLNPIPLSTQTAKDDVFSIETRINFNSSLGNVPQFVMPFSQQDPNLSQNLFSLDVEGGIVPSGIVMDGHLVAPVLQSGYHTYKFNFHGADWFIYVDGVQVASIHDVGRPAYLNFGNPNPAISVGNSVSMSIDYVKVTEPMNP